MEYDAFERLEGTTKVEIDTSIIDATNVDMPQGKMEAIRGGAKHCEPRRYRPKIVSGHSIKCGMRMALMYSFGSSRCCTGWIEWWQIRNWSGY